jgi:hypothetical protein
MNCTERYLLADPLGTHVLEEELARDANLEGGIWFQVSVVVHAAHA